MTIRDNRNERASNGRFVKGCKPGPGRPRGSSEHRAALLKACTPERVEEMVEALVDKARAGDATAARVIFDRLWGRPREEQPQLRAELPDLSDPKAIGEAMRLVVAAVARGELPADHGRIWTDLLSACAEAAELGELLRQHEGEGWRRRA